MGTHSDGRLRVQIYCVRCLRRRKTCTRRPRLNEREWVVLRVWLLSRAFAARYEDSGDGGGENTHSIWAPYEGIPFQYKRACALEGRRMETRTVAKEPSRSQPPFLSGSKKSRSRWPTEEGEGGGEGLLHLNGCRASDNEIPWGSPPKSSPGEASGEEQRRRRRLLYSWGLVVILVVCMV